MAEAEYRPGIERVLGWVRRRRALRQHKAVKAVDRFQKRGVLPDLKRTAKDLRLACRGHVSDDPAVRARREAVMERLEDLLAMEPCVDQPAAVAEHHTMRIAAKRLRYALEVFRPLYGASAVRFVAAARQAQRRLGEIHDCDVLGQFPAAVPPGGRGAVARARQAPGVPAASGPAFCSFRTNGGASVSGSSRTSWHSGRSCARIACGSNLRNCCRAEPAVDRRTAWAAPALGGRMKKRPPAPALAAKVPAPNRLPPCCMMRRTRCGLRGWRCAL